MKLKILNLLFWVGISISWSEVVRGTNADLDQSWTPREASTGRALLGLSGAIDTWMVDPASLGDLSQSGLFINHSQAPLLTQYHQLGGVYVLEPQKSTLGFSFGRFASDEIPLIDEGEVIQGSEYRTFNLVDYLFHSAYGYTWKSLQFGVVGHFLYRELDQSGLGFRADADLKYKWRSWRLGTSIEGISSSLAKWESDYVEYAPPEMKIGLGYEVAVPYFYGNFAFAWQSAGIFQNQAKSLSALNAKDDGTGDVIGLRAWDDPLPWLMSSALGVEYQSTTGLYLRGGTRDLRSVGSYSWGTGFHFWKIQMEYAFEPHADLGSTHRFGFQYHFGSSPKNSESQIQIPMAETKFTTTPESSAVSQTPQENTMDSTLIQTPTEEILE